jgi:sarcosine oxidase subunit beta
MRELPRTADVVIVGGGVIGVSIAYHLAKKGMTNLLLLEKDSLGAGATGKCAGGIRMQFTTGINIRFSLLSLEIFENFRSEFDVDPEFHRVGYLFLARGERDWTILKGNARRLKNIGIEVRLLDQEELKDHWPFLYVGDLQGGTYTPRDGYAGPYEVLQGFAKGARRGGVMLKEGVEVAGIRHKAGRVEGVVTSRGETVKTPVVVNAAGPYAARLGDMLELKIPVRPLRRQVFFTDPFASLPQETPLVIDLEHGWYMRREGRGLLLAGPQDAKSSFNEGVDFEGRTWTAERSMHRVPVLKDANIARGWAGLYAISPDHHAIIGSFPEMEGFICANGFSGHGFQHSPAVGLLVSELIAEGRASSMDIRALRPDRFRDGGLIHEPLTAFRD